ncbi:hypothetical protein EEJ34_03070 [Vibrio cholerae]|nr:hypothetical protein [Vibrio cholerae]EGR2063565.1 hypothetical protein [Vibrio cholerae]EGR2115120.1 hypothetical protein [Vibrio cholerae]EGR2125469.1 hypothetical protein [Vibrio cholerae]EGR2243346.1 hypothetical protein [Vibrio cholerae]
MASLIYASYLKFAYNAMWFGKPLETAKASYEAFVLFVCVVQESIWNIPLLLEAAAVLATFVHPNHIMYLCSWG